MFSLREKNGQKAFKEFTTNTNKFSKCFLSEENFENQFKKLQKVFQKSLHACFRRIRVKDRVKVSNIDILINKKKDILKKDNLGVEDTENINYLDKMITEQCENREYEKLVNIVGSLETCEGSTNNTSIWKQLRKSFPNKNRPIPTGVTNSEG